eukprot:5020781-Pyramimonas_sp.AAC.1
MYTGCPRPSCTPRSRPPNLDLVAISFEALTGEELGGLPESTSRSLLCPSQDPNIAHVDVVG